MQAYTYVSKGKFELREKPKPTLMQERDAIVKVTLASICSSDLHIKHGSVPRAVPGITVGHEMVGIVEAVGSAVKNVKPGDRVTVNVETFCGECFFCKKGYVNNCTDQNGGWALGCRIDGGQAEYVRVPFADQGLNKIPDGVTDRQALLVGDVLATGFWAAHISEITKDDTVLILGAGPTGICTLLCVMLKKPKRIVVCETDENRVRFIRAHYPEVMTVSPEDCADVVRAVSDHGGADVVLEVAGAEGTFRLAWECARPNAIVTVVALYDKAQTLPLPDMYGKNLTFKTGGVDGCHCEETLKLIAEGKLDTEPLIPHTYPLSRIEEAYELFEKKQDYKPGTIQDDAKGKDVTMFTGSFQEMWSNIGSVLGNDMKVTSTLLDAYYASSVSLDTSRDSVSSVDFNDEAMNLMQYSKSYSAACRLMTTIDSVLDKLINGTGA